MLIIKTKIKGAKSKPNYTLSLLIRSTSLCSKHVFVQDIHIRIMWCYVNFSCICALASSLAFKVLIIRRYIICKLFFCAFLNLFGSKTPLAKQRSSYKCQPDQWHLLVVWENPLTSMDEDVCEIRSNTNENDEYIVFSSLASGEMIHMP